MKLPKGNSATPIKQAVCLILAAILLFSLGPQNVWATEDALEESGTEGILLLEEEATQYYTVTFYIDASTSSTITIKNGDYCIEPEVPAIPAGMNSFLGWFLEGEPVEVGNYFVFENEPIYENIVLIARFSPDYLVHFLDIAGQVAYSELVEPDEYITAPALSLLSPAGKLFTGKWRLEEETEPFDFENQSITGNFTFLPILEDLYLIQFVTDGTLEEPQTIVINGQVTEPENTPSRPGYRFLHWSLEENGAAYDFSTPVTSDLTIYAVWEAEDVGIRVVYWLENENLSLDFDRDNLNNYSYATALNYEVKAGSEIYADTSSLSLNISTQSAIPLFPSDTAFSIATLQVDDNGSVSNGAPYASFYTASAIEGKTTNVSGDGSTVINVYLTRNIYNLNFVIDNLVSPYSVTLSDTMQELMELSKKEFTAADNGIYSYTVQAKIGMQVSELVPSPFYGNSVESHFTYSYPNYEMRGWGPWKMQSMTSLTTRHLMTDSANQYANSFVSATNTATYKSYFDTNVYRTVLYTFVESLDQGATGAPEYPFGADGTVADRLNVQELIYSQDPNGNASKVRTLYSINENVQYFDLYLTSLPFYAATNDRQITTPISGYTLYTAFPNGDTANYACYQWGSPTFVTAWYSNFEGFYQLYNGAGNENANEASRFFFFARNSYEIEFYYTNYETGGSTNITTESIKFGAPIQDWYWVPDTPANVVFEGWYLDSHLTQPFTFENATMPASSAASGVSLNLYAKYKVEDYGATFLDQKNGNLVATEAFSSGSTISDPEIYLVGDAYEGLGVFLGWYYTSASGQDVVFNFRTLLNDNIELFGMWRTTGFTVTYDLNGGTGSSPVPVDNNKYNLDNLARVASLSGVYQTVAGKVYVFAGWTLNPDGSGTIYYPGNTVSVYGDITLYARYVPATAPVTLTYHQNTSSSDTVQTAWVMNMGDDVSLPSASSLGYAYYSYAFLGWSRDPEATEPDNGLTAGGQLIKSVDTALYAVWSRGAFTVV